MLKLRQSGPMQSSSPASGDAPPNQPNSQRLRLPMPSPLTQINASHGLSLDTSMTPHGSTSPVQPTWSPLTPTSSQGEFAPPSHSQDFDQGTQPLSLVENPDAIALRNAIAILQIQRQQSIKDIQSLERLKQTALDDPQGFLSDLKDKKLTHPARAGIHVDDDDSASEDGNTDSKNRSKFGSIPAAQNVVRCPPVNWDKYHIVGESLEKLHEQQRNFPGVTERQIQRSGHPLKHTIAAPYRPGMDVLDEKTANVQSKPL